ncbi:MAG: protein translocase subunit SecF [Thiovulaceae bacterium]|nr:protein translocase subunit SecF [Sulfurimonadaceae bacterium]
MELFSFTKPIDFMGKSKLSLAFSGFLVVASIVLILFKGLNLGIDFAGGTLVQVKYDSAAPMKKMREVFAKDATFSGSTISEFGSAQEVIVRVKKSSGDVTSDLGDVARKLLVGTGNFEIRRVDIVGPKVGNELREKGLMAMLLAIIGILIYISIRFEWRFAIASVFALIHDVSIAMGMLVVFNVDINLDILAALLTILGYSLNDTIIVFDRIREGLMKSKTIDLFTVINDSVTKTLARTTLTSLTTFFVVLTLFLFGGEIIHGFAFTLLVGVIVGTYSSIFVASPLLKQFGFSIANYRNKLAMKDKREKEKARMRAQFEQGSI